MARLAAATAMGMALLTFAATLSKGPPAAPATFLFMPPNTAVTILLLSSALLLLHGGGKRLLWAQALSLISLAVSLLALVGLAFGEYIFVQVGAYRPMTAGAALLASVLATSVLMAHPETGIMKILTSPTAGGMMARRLLSPAVAIPVLLAWLAYQWQLERMASDAIALVVVAVGASFFLFGLLWSQALTIDRYDRAYLNNHLDLARIEENVRLLVETARDHAIYRLDTEGRILTWNSGAQRILGYPADEIVGAPFDTLFEQADIAAGLPARILATARAQGHTTGEHRNVRRDGKGMYSHMGISALHEANSPVGFVVVMQDISERKAAEEELRRSKQDLEVALEGANVHLWHMDWPSKSLSYMDHLPHMLGYAPEEVSPELDFWLTLLHPEDRAHLLEMAEQAARQTDTETGRHQKKPLEAEVRMRARDGHWIWTLIRARAVERDASNMPLRIAGTCLNIDERKQAEERMLHIAQHDTLTGLPNRELTYAFGERVLASARRDKSRCAVLFIDLDRFKPINDTYGHDAGDAVLRETAQRLTGCVRGGDVLGRLGGDEFLIVLTDVDGLRGAGRVAAQCIAALGRPFFYHEQKLQISSSIGISLFPTDANDIFTLIKRADTAMYHAKESGRDNFQFFTEEMNARALNALNMENRLRNGLQRREFRLHYQPIIESGSGEVIGAEALLRWPDADIMPEQFMPVAEYSGLINPLGEWALREACRQQRAWQSHGMNALKISVNVSPAQFRQPGFRNTVARAVTESGIDPQFLQLEVSESMLAQSTPNVIETLQLLRQLGLRVVLDDFGKGQSSLYNLKQLPVDAIKIDRDFTHDMHAGSENMAITGAIINLGKDLGLQVIAEGIESEETFHSLQERQCEMIQGFYVGRPMPIREFEAWYHQRHAVAEAAAQRGFLH